MTVEINPKEKDLTILSQPLQNATPQKIQLNSAEADRLGLKPVGEDAYEVLDNRTGQVLGTVHQPASASHTVELYWGKGGFTAIVTSPKGLKYFALPGATLSVGETRVSLPGEQITGNASKVRQDANRTAVQRHTRQATILGAGLATRFEPVSGENTQYAKPSVPLAGERSVIRCIVDTLQQDGFDTIIINTFFKPNSLKAGLANAPGVEIRYIDEAQPSGTAGGLRKMLMQPDLAALLDQTKPLLVIQGDAVSDVNLSELLESHARHNALVTIGCQMVPDKDVSKFGIIVTDRSGEDGVSGCITGFQEKPSLEEAKSRLGNTGFYVIAPQAFPLIRRIYEDTLASEQAKAEQAGQPKPTEVALDFANDIFPAILKHVQSGGESGTFRAQAVEGYWSDIGNPAQYLETVHDIYGGKVNLDLGPQPQTFYRNGVVYWPGAQAVADAEGAELSGNVIVALPFQG